jgi:hypothetical protein
VLPSQLSNVIDDIKSHLLDQCIVYNFVRSESSYHLKNLLGEVNCKTNLIKPNYIINMKLDYLTTKWNYELNIIESLGLTDVIEMTNPFVTNECKLK